MNEIKKFSHPALEKYGLCFFFFHFQLGLQSWKKIFPFWEPEIGPTKVSAKKRDFLTKMHDFQEKCDFPVKIHIFLAKMQKCAIFQQKCNICLAKMHDFLDKMHAFWRNDMTAWQKM